MCVICVRICFVHVCLMCVCDMCTYLFYTCVFGVRVLYLYVDFMNISNREGYLILCVGY